MFCPRCGYEVSDVDKFCMYCGAALDAKGVDFGDATNPFDVGAQTQNASIDDDERANVVPSGPWDACKICFRKYFNGRGRASQAEYGYWLGFLALTLGVPLAIAALAFFDIALKADGGEIFPFDVPPIVCIAPFYCAQIWGAACLFPTIYVVVRRLHDLNYTGWFALALLLGWIGMILLAVLAAIPGTPGPNRFGPPPAARSVYQ